MVKLKIKVEKIFFGLMSPVFWLSSLLMPKDNRIWAFGSWFGQGYSDNTKYIFQEAIRDPKIRAVWITKNPAVVIQVQSVEGAEVYYAYSIKGLFMQLRARVFCMTVNSNDFYFAMLTPKNIQVQFWHGSPIKKICFDAWHGFEYFKNKVRAILIDDYDFFISPSKTVDELMKSAFQLVDSNFVRSAYPRCDGLFGSDFERVEMRRELCIPAGHKLFVYMPTHRNEGASPKLIEQFYETFSSIAADLHANDITVVMKPHFYELENARHFQSLPGLKVVGGVDAYKLLGAADGLVTDVSSICFDFEVTRKPIVFFMPDVELYEKADRETYFKLQDVAKVVCEDKEMLLSELLKASRGRGNSGLKVNMNEDFDKHISSRLLVKLVGLVDNKLKM